MSPASHRESVCRNRRVYARQFRQFKCCCVVEKALVIDRQYRQVAVVPDERHLRRIPFRHAFFLQLKVFVVAHVMGVGQYFITLDDKSRPHSLAHRLRLPGRHKIEFLPRAAYHHNRLLHPAKPEHGLSARAQIPQQTIKAAIIRNFLIAQFSVCLPALFMLSFV